MGSASFLFMFGGVSKTHLQEWGGGWVGAVYLGRRICRWAYCRYARDAPLRIAQSPA